MNNIFSFNLLHSSISTESSIVEFKSDEEKLKIEVSYFIARAGLRSGFAFIIVCILNHALQVDIPLELAWHTNSRHNRQQSIPVAAAAVAPSSSTSICAFWTTSDTSKGCSEIPCRFATGVNMSVRPI
jgi:hypothetical protein